MSAVLIEEVCGVAVGVEELLALAKLIVEVGLLAGWTVGDVTTEERVADVAVDGTTEAIIVGDVAGAISAVDEGVDPDLAEPEIPALALVVYPLQHPLTTIANITRRAVYTP